ncbi:uncharacterized protein LOC129950652 [Eupeodes corollae]|uniref:uncharacterized protein LOC129950652 n=1 Tax=Eupeodes corollae TaxID=290404 RepID=UPI00248F9D89|nr:uncharacterized protein LOC129950652 [Eupeodes corollae]
MENKSFIFEFIELYRSLPALWNIKGKEYANRDLKNNQYENRLKKYQEKYPEATKKDVSQKINTLRTNYRRELKRISGLERSGSGLTEENESTLFYFDAMDFLRDDEAKCPSRSSIEVKENITEYVCMFLYFKEVEAEAPRKRKKSDPSDELIILAAKRLSEPKNEFRAVADTWALKLKKLEETQRMFAEKFINDILFEAQMGGLHRNSMHLSVVSRTCTPVSNACLFF